MDKYESGCCLINESRNSVIRIDSFDGNGLSFTEFIFSDNSLRKCKMPLDYAYIFLSLYPTSVKEDDFNRIESIIRDSDSKIIPFANKMGKTKYKGGLFLGEECYYVFSKIPGIHKRVCKVNKAKDEVRFGMFDHAAVVWTFSPISSVRFSTAEFVVCVISQESFDKIMKMLQLSNVAIDVAKKQLLRNI